MTDPEDPEAKNEQELNLFSDMPRPDETPAAQESGAFGLSAQDAPAESASGEPAASPEIRADDMPAPEPARETPEKALSAPAGPEDDIPVVAPPPPRKQPSPVRPGIVMPRAGRPAVPAPSATGSAKTRRPLPLALQPAQSLGQMFAAVRNARGMTLEEVAAATRIRTEYLVELESDMLLKTLPPVYVSAYVRKLIEVYDLPAEDGDLLLEKMHGAAPKNTEELPDKLIESVNEGALVNEDENKRIRKYTIVIFIVIGFIAAALLWLVVLVIVHYVRTPDPAPAHDPAAVTSGAVQPAEEPVSRTVRLDESELDALIVPETPSISVLKMSKTPGVRESL